MEAVKAGGYISKIHFNDETSGNISLMLSKQMSGF